MRKLRPVGVYRLTKDQGEIVLTGNTEDRFDIVIAGGGYVGRSLALALAQAAPELEIALVDARPLTAALGDKRASAIAAAAKRLLTVLNIWRHLEPHAQPISQMVVTDSKLSDSIRPVFLTFGDEAEMDEPFAHMVPNAALVGALGEAGEHSGVAEIAPDQVTDFQERPGFMEVALGSGRTLRAKLLIACDGVNSRLRALSGIATHRLAYGQTAIVGTVHHEEPHDGRAFEHFLPAGPFAILPLPANDEAPHRSSIVWTETDENAAWLMEADPFALDMELQRRFGPELGEAQFATAPQAYPLALTSVSKFVQSRFALAGDAAHGIHPIAGQGLNLGFKDVAALSETLVEAHRLGQDIGDELVLEGYQRWRRFDTARMGMTTDLLNRLFVTDIAPVRLVRSAGLRVVNRFEPLKKLFIQTAAGLGAGEPRLLKGEEI